ncbi:hypothetical protein ACOMICROBIO_FLGHMIGD_02144 [Vibrio sp. B1FLJ16]|uniref:DUF1127 domain-containing protein n=1 Tax=Vibrio sp. B1FLJ16 TaxID=2751178 RepID=UPI0015F6B2E7|nr:DUF1127 domain-containing protein [Vibrio sp. B1FLJ16]CAD7810274.1 hypothetical protein ACOMICROBIO_FLGHMIGD_02144 [Vibrio sp. B1FLJ16]CAE6911873.1 hypothetical protein ACOMICROBIO_FLGHMIGD_02144 [Vibrio sp. B1FLJ16]
MESMTRPCEYGLIKREQSWIQLIISKLFLWRRNYRTRRHLSELPEHLWDDIGLEKQEILKESCKPFWRE